MSSLQEVTYQFNGRVDCQGCPLALVVLAVPPALVLRAYDDLYGFVNANIKAVVNYANQSTLYTFEFDDVQLVNPDAGIKTNDIYGFFCKGILTSYIEDRLRRAQPIIVGTDT